MSVSVYRHSQIVQYKDGDWGMKKIIATTAALAASPAFAFSHSLSVPDAMHRAEHLVLSLIVLVAIAGMYFFARRTQK